MRLGDGDKARRSLSAQFKFKSDAYTLLMDNFEPILIIQYNLYINHLRNGTEWAQKVGNKKVSRFNVSQIFY